MSEKMKARAVSLLAKAGITINGTEPHSLLVRDERLYRRVFAHGSLGFCEAFMDGWWGARDLPAFFRKIFAVNLHRELWGIETALLVLQARILDMQSVRRSKRVARQHYDLTPVHEAMLGAYRVYSGGYWRGGAKTLDEAQSAQLERNCQMLALRPGETLLDMGCGWGEQLKWAWTHHGVRGVGLTLSHEQVEKELAAYSFEEKKEEMRKEIELPDAMRASSAPICRLSSTLPIIGILPGVTTKSSRRVCSSTWAQNTAAPSCSRYGNFSRMPRARVRSYSRLPASPQEMPATPG